VVYFDFEEHFNQNKDNCVETSPINNFKKLSTSTIGHEIIKKIQTRLLNLSYDKSAIVLFENFQTFFLANEFASNSNEFLHDLLYMKKKFK
jgi:hypothetical protein